MPIDNNFRNDWRIVSKHEGHSVWRSETGKDEIHGMAVGVLIESCIGCMKCISACPTDVFVPWKTPQGVQVVDPLNENECIICLLCEIVCPVEAIHVHRQDGSQETLDSLLGDV
ncbi:MAG: 4Fe-4S dicluster domain-containing protein [Candidatus Thorarchaeota archaeon]|nr:4Fe-4S dicluster domain-containing protein [Candidatus Thorarchaeota archaeon]